MNEHVPLRSDFALTAAYTRMARGFGGHPKLHTLLDLNAHCLRAGPAWKRAVGEFSDQVIDLISLWARYQEESARDGPIAWVDIQLPGERR